MAENATFDDLDDLDDFMKGGSINTREQNSDRYAASLWALQLISDFAGTAKGGVWPNLSRVRIASGLAARVKNPVLINQSSTNLCGITTVVRDWCKDSPVDYAWAGICLYNDGVGRLARGQMIGETLRPSAELKRSSVPEDMNQADWIVLASTHETLVKKYGHGVQDFLGIKYYDKDEGLLAYKAWQAPSEVVAAFKAMGYRNVIDNTCPTSPKGINDLEKANELLRAGYKVSLLINARLLDDSTMGSAPKLVQTSNHWVDMLELINVMGEYTYAFKVYSWGDIVRVPNKQVDAKLRTVDLMQNFFGYVAGRLY